MTAGRRGCQDSCSPCARNDQPAPPLAVRPAPGCSAVISSVAREEGGSDERSRSRCELFALLVQNMKEGWPRALSDCRAGRAPAGRMQNACLGVHPAQCSARMDYSYGC